VGLYRLRRSFAPSFGEDRGWKIEDSEEVASAVCAILYSLSSILS